MARAILGLAALASFACLALSSRNYPLYKQCDPKWGKDLMGVKGPGERASICREGCAMSDVAMMAAGLGVQMNGALINPGSFNSWLKAHHGYLCIAGDCNNLVLNAVHNVTSEITLIGELEKPAVPIIAAGLAAGDRGFVAHVHHNGHFVLLTGHDPKHENTFMVNDPFYNSTSYPYGNITDVLMYIIQAPSVDQLVRTFPSTRSGRALSAGEACEGEVLSVVSSKKGVFQACAY